MNSIEIKVIENENEVYKKEKLLGEGAFGKAYLVKKIQTGELLVIKQMNIEHMSQKEKDQTIKEAQILKNLNHPNIVSFKEVYITKNNKLKIVMEYAECGDLAKTIQARKPQKTYLSETQILDWFTQICLAIKHVHDRKILHRDIKGQNIFISQNNSLKLGDFGIARVLNRTIDKARTVVGTPYYLSPQIIENKPYSFKSDIWSIGAVLYQMCALQPPFIANSLQMLALKIVKGSYPSLQGDYSKEIKNLISEMLTLDPNKRPAIHDILKKPLIQQRIKKFLSQTRQISEFSHTVLHNHKIQIGVNKLAKIQKQKELSRQKSSSSRPNSGSKEKKFESQRMKLKDEQARIEAMMKKRKQQQLRKEQKRRKEQQNQIRRRQQEIKRRQQEKRKWKVIQQKKKQQIQRQYEQNMRIAEMVKARHAEQQQEMKKQFQINSLLRQKQQLEQQIRQEKQRQKKKQKQIDDAKKQEQLKQFGRKQYYENLQIRKRAKQRAKMERQGISYNAQQNVSANYHYAKERPETKQERRNKSSVQKKINQSDYHSVNVEGKKFTQNNYRNVPPKRQQPKKKQSISEYKQIDKEDSKKKIQNMREKIKQDRQNYYKNKSKGDIITNQTEKTEQQNEIPVGKWEKRKSLEKRDSSREQSPRFGGVEQIQEQQIVNQINNDLIKQSENPFLEVKNPQEFGNYIHQLEDIVADVNKKVDNILLPEIPVCEEVLFRDDDELQFSLTAEPQNKQKQIQDEEDVNLEYFSDYSKLEELRIQLEDAFGLEEFIKLYRLLEEQMNENGLEGFNIIELQKQIDGQIDRKLFEKNATLVLMLVTLQDRMSKEGGHLL